jgi:hypothetical protein
LCYVAPLRALDGKYLFLRMLEIFWGKIDAREQQTELIPLAPHNPIAK